MIVRSKSDDLDFNADFNFLKTKTWRLNSRPCDFDRTTTNVPAT